MSSGKVPRWLPAIIAAAAVKIAVGLTGLLSFGWIDGFEDGRALLLIANLVLYSGGAVVLLAASRGDRRAAFLGAVFLCAASTAASNGLTPPEVGAVTWLGSIPALLNGLNPDAFLPLLIWMFFREFPRGRVRGLAHPVAVRFAVRVSTVAGVVLFAAAALAAIPLPLWQQTVLGPGFPLIFWAFVGAFSLPPLAYSMWRMRAADIVERRRIRLFMAGFVVGAGPLFATFVLGVTWPRLGRIITDPHDPWNLSLILLSLPLVIPLATAYAVLVQDVLDVRLVVRKAIRYALARYTVLAVTVVPFAFCALHLFLHRNRPLVEILSARQVLPLALLGGLGALLLATRRAILLTIDRRFFREQYDAYTILQAVVDSSRFVTSTNGLAALLREQVDRALHVECAAVLVLDREHGFFRSPDRSARKLPVSFLLVKMLAGGSDVMDIDLENPRSPLRGLPDLERQWLADGGFRLLVPIASGVGSMVGIMALGAKRSELPFSSEDCRLLVAASASAAVALERVLLSASDSGGGGRFLQQEDDTISSGELAGECLVCGAVHPHVGTTCATCGRTLRAAVLPKLSQGKYRLERRLGAGGMGVVYLAKDVELARQVAIKTLPRLSPERSVRLRREARAMASVNHPNVAMIYSVEAWQGVPLLILEYLPGGTVRERLAKGCFRPQEVVDLGIALSGALEAAHAAGVLHRDIKPSNVGFGRGGTAKLMDFGLARILAELELRADDHDLEPGLQVTSLNQSWTGPDRVVGTPGYLSPEAATGRQPEPSFDLWGLAVLLLESLIGRNPLRGSTVEATLLKVSDVRLAPVRELMPACPPALAALLDECLARNPGRRPRNARVMCQRLEVVRSQIDA